MLTYNEVHFFSVYIHQQLHEDTLSLLICENTSHIIFYLMHDSEKKSQYFFYNKHFWKVATNPYLAFLNTDTLSPKLSPK